MKLYAAVIEWPEDDPELVASRTPEGLFADVRRAVADQLDAYMPELLTDFRAAVASGEATGAASLGDWITAVQDADGGPWITTHETEV